MTSRPTVLLLLALSATVAGCGSNALTTGSLFGGGDKPAAAPPAPRNDPTARAFSAGAVTARAQKCGFNFDAARLRAGFAAAEVQAGTPTDEVAKAGALFDRAQATVAKAIAKSEDYCSDDRIAYIRGDLNRHLAGDFTPSRPRSFAKEDDGLFSFGGQSPNDESRTAASKSAN